MNFRTSPPCVLIEDTWQVEVAVEDIDHGFGRQPVGKGGEAAQIRQPDRGMHRIGVATAYLPAENPLAGPGCRHRCRAGSKRCGAS